MTNKPIAFRPSNEFLAALQTTANIHHSDKVNGETIEQLWTFQKSEYEKVKTLLSEAKEENKKLETDRDSLKRTFDSEKERLQNIQKDRTPCLVTGTQVFKAICEGCKRHAGIFPMCPLKLNPVHVEGEPMKSTTGGMISH